MTVRKNRDHKVVCSTITPEKATNMNTHDILGIRALHFAEPPPTDLVPVGELAPTGELVLEGIH